MSQSDYNETDVSKWMNGSGSSQASTSLHENPQKRHWASGKVVTARRIEGKHTDSYEKYNQYRAVVTSPLEQRLELIEKYNTWSVRTRTRR